MLHRAPELPYHPSYWLAALGAGGLCVSFFMYLMWLLPHPGTPIPIWKDLISLWSGVASIPATARFIGMLATVAVIVLALMHFILLGWNIRQYRAPENRADLAVFFKPGGQIQRMTVPLTLAMTVNVLFILGALFVPGLWQYVEYLFPFALLAFALIGWHAAKVYGQYLAGFLVSGGYRAEQQNHLSGLIAAFTFSMVSVGFAAPAAMSHIAVTSALAATLSILFFVLAVTICIVVLVGGATAMMTHGLSQKATPSIWMLVPVVTLLGIEWVRIQHGLAHHFSSDINAGQVFIRLLPYSCCRSVSF